MDMEEKIMWDTFTTWVYNFIVGCGDLWTWLITPIVITNDLTIAPIYLVVGGTILIGLVRAII